jgi:hypothetical protein
LVRLAGFTLLRTLRLGESKDIEAYDSLRTCQRWDKFGVKVNGLTRAGTKLAGCEYKLRTAQSIANHASRSYLGPWCHALLYHNACVLSVIHHVALIQPHRLQCICSILPRAPDQIRHGQELPDAFRSPRLNRLRVDPGRNLPPERLRHTYCRAQQSPCDRVPRIPGSAACISVLSSVNHFPHGENSPGEKYCNHQSAGHRRSPSMYSGASQLFVTEA